MSNAPKTRSEEIRAKLLNACNGHPHAKIPWPHRILHEAEKEIGHLLEINADLLAALEQIAIGDKDCKCDHNYKDCCNKVLEYCPKCLAEVAIARAKGQSQ